MSRVAVKPYLVAKDADGDFRVTVRETRFNSQGYPLVTSTLLDQTFPSATSARAYVRNELHGQTDDITAK